MSPTARIFIAAHFISPEIDRSAPNQADQCRNWPKPTRKSPCGRDLTTRHEHPSANTGQTQAASRQSASRYPDWQCGRFAPAFRGDQLQSRRSVAHRGTEAGKRCRIRTAPHHHGAASPSSTQIEVHRNAGVDVSIRARFIVTTAEGVEPDVGVIALIEQVVDADKG